MRDKLLLTVLIVVQGCILLWISWSTAPGWDEWGHLSSGLYSLQYGDFSPYCVNPPLVRLFVSIPVFLGGGGIAFEPIPHEFRTEALLALAYIQQHGEDCFYWISVARTAMIPVSIFGTYVLWIVGCRMYGATCGFMAAWLWAFSPTVLAFGASITPDISAVVFGLWSAYRCFIWLRQGSLGNAALLGIGIGTAMLCKSTWIILPPIYIVLCVVYFVSKGQRYWCWRSRLGQTMVALAVAWVLVHACYDFRGVLRPLGEFQFVSQSLSGIEGRKLSNGGNRFRRTWCENIPVPLPADYIRGIDFQKLDFELRMPSYFIGVTRDQGWWYYYILGIVFKEPAALWGLAIVCWSGIFARNRKWEMSVRKRTMAYCIYAPGVVVLLFVSTQTGFNHHLRYVLPFFPCLFLTITCQVSWTTRKLRILASSMLLLYSACSISILPRSYAYFSEIVGGSRQGWRYMNASNLDWGQDLLTLKHWIDRHPENRPIYVLYTIPILDLRKLGIEAEYGDDSMTENGPVKPGWWAVFASPMLEGNNAWFRYRQPDVELSVTTRLYYIPSHEKVRNE